MKRKNGIMILAIMLIACTLRSPITGVGSILPQIRAALGLSATAAGLLTTIPLLGFALVSLFVGRLGARFGGGRVILWSVAGLCAGLLVRSYLGVIGMFAGTVIIGLGIGVNNVMLPAVVKAEYPDRVGTITSAYTAVLSFFSALSGAVSVPIALAFGWQAALAVWLIVAALAFLAWFPSRKTGLAVEPEKPKRRSVAKSAISWYITLFMGFQSLLFFAFVSFFATILQSKGYSETAAGYYNCIMMICGFPGSLVVPVLAAKMKNQSALGAFLGLVYIGGMVAAIYAETTAGLVLTMICSGFASGSGLALSMTHFVLHTRNAEDASDLSGMAQGIGYLLAAAGPFLTGLIFDLCGGGSWTVPLLVLAGLGVVTTVFGWLSGMDRYVETEERSKRKT